MGQETGKRLLKVVSQGWWPDPRLSEGDGTFPMSGEGIAAISLEVPRISAGFCRTEEILQESWEVFLTERDEISGREKP